MFDPPRIPVHRGEGGIGTLEIGLGKNSEATMVVGRHAHFLAKHELLYLGVERLAHFGVGLDPGLLGLLVGFGASGAWSVQWKTS